MSFDRRRCALTLAAAGAALVLAGGCSSEASDIGVESRTSSPLGAPSASVRPLSEAELVAALPTEGTLPGYTVLGRPKSDADGTTSNSDVRPSACRPLWAIRAHASTTSVANAWVPITPSGAAPRTEFLSFASYDSGGADAYLASLDKALTTCSSLSFLNSYGTRDTADIERVEPQAALGDESVSFRMRWTNDQGGFKADTFVLITTVRAGEATVTDSADTSVGSQLSAAKKNTFMPKVDPDMLSSQAETLRKAQKP